MTERKLRAHAGQGSGAVTQPGAGRQVVLTASGAVTATQAHCTGTTSSGTQGCCKGWLPSDPALPTDPQCLGREPGLPGGLLAHPLRCAGGSACVPGVWLAGSCLAFLPDIFCLWRTRAGGNNGLWDFLAN